MAYRRVALWWGLLVLLLTVLIVIGTSQQNSATAQTADEGRVIFEAKCAACHTIGGGPLVGPDLEGVTTRREPGWLARWIAEPDVMLVEGDPLATQLLGEFNNVPMPNLSLTDVEVASLIAYLGPPATDSPPSEPVTGPLQPGDSSIGKGLFEGTIRFENRGPPCLACHSIAGIGDLGGGALGPDLTGAYGKFGEDTIISILATTPFPTMKPIFDDRPLTEQEQAHLALFLSQAAVRERTAATVGQLALLGTTGAVILLLLMRLVWRGRLVGVRRPMVARSNARIKHSKLAKREPQNTTTKVKGR